MRAAPEEVPGGILLAICWPEGAWHPLAFWWLSGNLTCPCKYPESRLQVIATPSPATVYPQRRKPFFICYPCNNSFQPFNQSIQNFLSHQRLGILTKSDPL